MPSLLTATLVCLALNVYHEARGEGIEGQFAVADVTLNRVESPKFPDTVCEVVKQGGQKRLNRCQFSWYCDGKSDEPRNTQAWLRAKQVAQVALQGLKGNTKGATFYHAKTVRPYWAKSFKRTAVIGSHIFYKEN